jgi:hypothetical protein
MARLSNFMPSARLHIEVQDYHLRIGGVDTVTHVVPARLFRS